LKLLFVITQPFDPEGGGVQMTTFKLCSFFVSKGYKSQVFSFSQDGHGNYGNIPLTHANDKGSYHADINKKYFREILEIIQPDVVINQMPYELFIGRILLEIKPKIGYLLIGCLRNSLFSVKLNIRDYAQAFLPSPLQFLSSMKPVQSIFQLLHKKKHAAQLKEFLDIYDYYVMFGKPNFGELSYFVGDYKKEKWKLIPNSIPDSLEQVPSKEKVLLHVGRLSIAQKRSDLLLPLWKKIHENLPDWRFVIVGDGPYRKEIVKQISNSSIYKNVEVLGKQPSYPYYEKAPLLVMMSAFEGFPNVIVEAQSRACAPVIMNSYPVASWLVNDDVNGLLAKPFDLEEMAKKIVETANSEENMNQLCEGALKNAEQFVIDKVGQQWLQLFNENIKDQIKADSPS
jgi:glycosyltransferase involved in cell wall biosynthesis